MAKIQLTAKKPVKSTIKKKLPAEKPNASQKQQTTATKLTGLSLKQLLKATPAYIRSNGDDVVVKALKQATTKGGMPGVRSKTQTPGSKTREVYSTDIVGKERGIPVSKQKHVIVSCSCSWFWSHCEYALNHWGSSVIKYSNGEPAVVTNPQNHPMLCKHLVALTKVVLEEGM